MESNIRITIQWKLIEIKLYLQDILEYFLKILNILEYFFKILNISEYFFNLKFKFLTTASSNYKSIILPIYLPIYFF